VAPRLYTSLAGPSRSSWPAACSGLMNAGVPIAAPGSVALLPDADGGRKVASPDVSGVPITFATPQSTTSVSPYRPTMMLPGLISRWSTPRLWA